MAVTGRRLTLDEFLALPEEKPALEYLDGVALQQAPANVHRARLRASIPMRLEMTSTVLDPLVAFILARITFAGRSLVPDAVAYRASRVPVDVDGTLQDDLTVPPDVAIEVTSPGQSIEDQDDRCRWLVENGVTVALRVNPRTEVVRVFRADEESGDLRGTDVIDLDDVAPGQRFTIDDLFGALRRPPLPPPAD